MQHSSSLSMYNVTKGRLSMEIHGNGFQIVLKKNRKPFIHIQFFILFKTQCKSLMLNLLQIKLFPVARVYKQLQPQQKNQNQTNIGLLNSTQLFF